MCFPNGIMLLCENVKYYLNPIDQFGLIQANSEYGVYIKVDYFRAFIRLKISQLYWIFAIFVAQRVAERVLFP